MITIQEYQRLKQENNLPNPQNNSKKVAKSDQLSLRTATAVFVRFGLVNAALYVITVILCQVLSKR